MNDNLQSGWKGGVIFTIFVFLLTHGTAVLAERYGVQETKKVNPFPSSHVEKIDSQLKVPGVIKIARSFGTNATEVALGRALAKHEDNALASILRSFKKKRFGEAEVFAHGLLEELEERLVLESGERKKGVLETREKTKVLLGTIFNAQGKFEQEANILDKVKTSIKGATFPIRDIVLFRRAAALEKLGRPSEAVVLYDQIMALDSSLFHRAKVRRARSLFKAGRWSEAEPSLRFVNENYTQYPRRPATLFERAFSLERLGKPEDAADAYQELFFTYPYKGEGQKARARLDVLEKEAILPSKILPARDKYLRYRRLRINKHWDTAMALFAELKEDHLSESGHSAFEHEIEFQMMLTDFKRRRFDAALVRLRELATAYELGNRAGISRYLIYRYMSSIYGLRGKHIEAIALIDKMTKGMSAKGRYQARAEYWEKHGMYKKAFNAFQKVWSWEDKKTWHYAWLLYKSGRLKKAYRLFRQRAENVTGRARAMHLYWAARSLERAGLNEEAYTTFASVSRAYASTYYGIQAKNRLVDLEQRTSVHGSIEAKTEGIVNSGEKALDAFDNAIQSWDDTPLREIDDGREKPRHALWGDPPLEEDYISVMVCTPESKETYCDAVWGDKDDTPKLFSPLDPELNIAVKGAAAANQIKPEEKNTLSELEEDRKFDYDFPTLADAKLPKVGLRFPKHLRKKNRINYPTSARMYWAGRTKEKFTNFRNGESPGPWPKSKTAYDTRSDYGGRLQKAQLLSGLFPNLERALWLKQSGLDSQAREAIRFVAEEFYELRNFARPRNRPHQIERLRWAYRIDNRRKGKRQFWGILDESLKYPVPRKKGAARTAALERQQEIYDRREEIQTLLIGALKETQDYYFVRKLTLRAGGWRNKSPHGPARSKWTQIYPRAFPELVLKSAKKTGMNPYMMWALMMVESSFNPDSISPADAMGLFQVIPRTGLKTAIMFKDDQFGSLDLLRPEVAVEHGGFYLSSLIKKFHGQELLAIPGYNGGPHRIGDWLEMRGDNPLDEFIEEIPFDEARGYAKKVFRFMVLFLKIYEGIDTMYVGQNLRKTYKAMPNF